MPPSQAIIAAVAPPDVAPPTSSILRRLFLTLFLRGRTSRGIRRETAPKSVGQKLALTLLFYFLFGAIAASFIGQSVFALCAYLHAMTFVFLGLFIASSAGEILFNREEPDLLLHRPIDPRALLWAKIRVLVEISLWLSLAFNLAGFFIGIFARDGGWIFIPVHLISTILESLFCTGCVVLVYQLCLRWFGRERLDGLMTAAQMIVSIAAVLSGQLLPRLLFNIHGQIGLSSGVWWIGLIPPAWFAGFDDALAGSHARASWILGAIAITATAVVLFFAVGKLAGDYQSGLQVLSESTGRPRRAGRRWIDILVDVPPLSWFLRDPVTRASFLLSAAYLMRDRDVKLRIYPGLAPILIFPFVIFLQRGTGSPLAGEFGVAFVASYLGLIPLMGITLLQYSQQWQASDVFRVAPIPGPFPIAAGARRAIIWLITAPLVVILTLIVLLLNHDLSQLLLILPGVLALPVYAMFPALMGAGLPLSLPVEEAKSTSRGIYFMAAMLISLALSALAWWSRSLGFYSWFLAGECLLLFIVYITMRLATARSPWPSME